jgi:hypothetical protein
MDSESTIAESLFKTLRKHIGDDAVFSASSGLASRVSKFNGAVVAVPQADVDCIRGCDGQGRHDAGL